MILILSCGGTGDKYDGLILVNPKTQQRYVLRHSRADVYFVSKLQKILVTDGDTTYITTNK
jgi:hypothetical protein